MRPAKSAIARAHAASVNLCCSQCGNTRAPAQLKALADGFSVEAALDGDLELTAVPRSGLLLGQLRSDVEMPDVEHILIEYAMPAA